MGRACQAEDAHQSQGESLASRSWVPAVRAWGPVGEPNWVQFIDEETEARERRSFSPGHITRMWRTRD